MTSPATLDVEALLIGWLSRWLTEARVVADLPGELERALPVVQLQRIGGARVHQPWAARAALHHGATVDVDVFAPSRERASDLISLVCELLPGLLNSPTAGGVVTSVVENVGPSWRPDYNPRVRRFGATYEFTIRPEPSR